MKKKTKKHGSVLKGNEVPNLSEAKAIPHNPHPPKKEKSVFG